MKNAEKEIVNGKKVYFMGPPAYVTTDGKDISAEFEEIIGRKIDFTSIYMGPHEYPHWDLWFTDRVIPMVTYCSVDYPIEAVKGNVWYYGYDAPLTEAMFDIIGSLSEYKNSKERLSHQQGILKRRRKTCDLDCQMKLTNQ